MKKMLNKNVIIIFSSIVIAAMVIACLAIVFSVKANAATKVDVVGKYDMVVYGLLDCEYTYVNKASQATSYEGGYAYTANNKTYRLGHYNAIHTMSMNSHLFLFNEIAAIIAVTEANSGTQSDILNMIQSYNEFEKRDEYPASSSSNYESELVTFYDGYYNGANLSTAKSLYSDIYKQITEYPPFTEYMNR